MTETELANRSLRLARLDTIDSLDDYGHVPSYLKSNLQSFIDEFLEAGDYHWNFARVHKPLVQVPSIFKNYTFSYDLPDNMIKYEQIDHSGGKLQEWEFDMYSDDTLADRSYYRLACNYPELFMTYTKRITHVNKLPPYFTKALTYLIGYYLAETFTGTERSMVLSGQFEQKEKLEAIAKDRGMTNKSQRGQYTTLEDADVRRALWRIR